MKRRNWTLVVTCFIASAISCTSFAKATEDDSLYPCPPASFVQSIGALINEAQKVHGIWLADYYHFIPSPNGLDWVVGTNVHAKNEQDAINTARKITAQITHPTTPNAKVSENSGMVVCYYEPVNGEDKVFAYTGRIG